MNNENLSFHFKVKDFNSWETSYLGNAKNWDVCRNHEKQGIPQHR